MPPARHWFEDNGEPEIRKEMKAVAAKRRRFGYRWIGVMLERKGMTMNRS